MPKPNEIQSNVAANVSPEEIPGIVARLRAAFNTDKTRSKAWRISQLNALNRLLTEGRDELARGLFDDMRCSPFEAFIQQIGVLQQEIYEALQHLDEWMADEYVSTNMFNLPALSCIQKDPLGVVLAIGAWNYNVLLTLSPVIGAIAAGNCVVIKPGSYAQHSAHAMVNLIPKYMDNECIVCIEGNRHITQAILAQKFDAMFFTGSPSVGKVVAEAAAKQLCPVVLELGGKSPCIITESVGSAFTLHGGSGGACLSVAARRTIWGALLNSGQTCVRPDTYFVHESVADQYINECVAAIKEFYGGDCKNSPYYGRLVNDAAFERLTKCLNDGKKYIVYGGASDASERYMEPTLFDFGSDWEAFAKSELMQDEIFGPLLPIIRYKDLDTEVIPFIRARPKPLALYIFSTDSEQTERVLRLTSSGGAVVNDVVVNLINPALPFGGVGESGLGTYHGKRTFDNFTHLKAVMKRTMLIDPPQRYPPFTQDKVMFLNLAFYPPISYYYSKFAHTFGDIKNLALLALGAYSIRGMVSKL